MFENENDFRIKKTDLIDFVERPPRITAEVFLTFIHILL